MLKTIICSIGRAAQSAAIVLLAWGGLAIAQQQGFSAINPILIGHFMNGGSGGTAVPTTTNCTLVAGSSDTDGSCATTSTTATITFAQTFATAPMCGVWDASPASATSMPAWTTSTTAITLSVVITAHTLFWHCGSKVGG